MRSLASTKTAVWTSKRESHLNRRELNTILFSQGLRVKDNREILSGNKNCGDSDSAYPPSKIVARVPHPAKNSRQAREKGGYSSRSDTTGSTLVVRQAGMTVAA